jgi:hypothetical protein
MPSYSHPVSFEQASPKKRWVRIWLVNKAKVEPKTVQGILRHAKIQTTLDLYTRDDSDESTGRTGRFSACRGDE